MLRTITLTAAAALISGPVLAQDINFAGLSYTYDNFSDDVSDEEVTFGAPTGAVEFMIGDILLSGDVFRRDIALEDGDETIDLAITEYAVGAGYMLSPRTLVGADLTGIAVDVSDDAETEFADVNGFLAYGQFQLATGYAYGLSIGKQDTDADNVTTTGYFEVYPVIGVTLGGQLRDQSETDGIGFYTNFDYDAGDWTTRTFFTTDTNLDAYFGGARGSYEFADNIRANAAFQVGSFDGTDSTFYGYAIGAGYQVVDGAWIDASYGQFGNTDADENVDVLQASISYTLGDRVRLDRRFAQSQRDDARSAGFSLLRFPIGGIETSF